MKQRSGWEEQKNKESGGDKQERIKVVKRNKETKDMVKRNNAIKIQIEEMNEKRQVCVKYMQCVCMDLVIKFPKRQPTYVE